MSSVPSMEVVPGPESGDDPATEPKYYATAAGLFCRDRIPGHTPPVQLANFDARIEEDVIVDDGAVTSREFVIEATVSGRRGPVTVPAAEFGAMKWVPDKLGAQAILFAGTGLRDHVRAAIQELSKPRKRVHYAHTGWRSIGGKFIYLTSSGGLGAGGLDARFSVRLPGALSGIALPSSPMGPELHRAVRALLRLTLVASPGVMWTTLVAVLAAVIDGVDFAIHFVGPTGVGKSEAAALYQQCFGSGLDARHLPASWSSTENSLEALAFVAKDIVLVVDDFVPGGSVQDRARTQAKAERLFRAQGNRSGRARLTASSAFVQGRPPRGLVLSTGEEPPRGQSIEARSVILEFRPDTVDFQRLTVSQKDAAEGRLALAMSAFVQWLAPQLDELRKYVREDTEAKREADQGTRHRRTATIEARLYATLKVFAKFASESGALEDREVADVLIRGQEAIARALEGQGAYHAESEPTARFLDLLRSGLLSGQFHVTTVAEANPASAALWGWREAGSQDWKPQGSRVGWIDGDSVYLEPEAVYAAVNRLAATGGEGSLIGSKTLWKRLAQKKLLLTCDSDDRNKVRKQIGGMRLRVLHLAAASIHAPNMHTNDREDEG